MYEVMSGGSVTFSSAFWSIRGPMLGVMEGSTALIGIEVLLFTVPHTYREVQGSPPINRDDSDGYDDDDDDV